jgi:hypothetical protein
LKGLGILPLNLQVGMINEGWAFNFFLGFKGLRALFALIFYLSLLKIVNLRALL